MFLRRMWNKKAKLPRGLLFVSVNAVFTGVGRDLKGFRNQVLKFYSVLQVDFHNKIMDCKSLEICYLYLTVNAKRKNKF